MRNTKIIDIVHELQEYNIDVDIFDPWVESAAAQREYNVTTISKPQSDQYDSIILAVAHQQFIEMGIDNIRALGKDNHVLYDLKYIFARDESDIRL